MCRHFTEVYVSQVTSSVTKHITWYSKEEKPRLKKKEKELTDKEIWKVVGETT